jgi:hypothetical protein
MKKGQCGSVGAALPCLNQSSFCGKILQLAQSHVIDNHRASSKGFCLVLHRCRFAR